MKGGGEKSTGSAGSPPSHQIVAAANMAVAGWAPQVQAKAIGKQATRAASSRSADGRACAVASAGGRHPPTLACLGHLGDARRPVHDPAVVHHAPGGDLNGGLDNAHVDAALRGRMCWRGWPQDDLTYGRCGSWLSPHPPLNSPSPSPSSSYLDAQTPEQQRLARDGAAHEGVRHEPLDGAQHVADGAQVVGCVAHS